MLSALIVSVHIVDILQQWSENNAFFTWLRESPSLWAYPFVFFVHTLGLMFTAGASVVIDARLLGAARKLPIPPLSRFFRAIWIGVAFTVVSGLVMLGTDVQTKVMNRVFPLKMLFVLAAIVLTAVLRTHVASTRVESPSFLVRALAAASLVCWCGAIASGKFAAYF
jgi:hypothetical protein